MTGLALRRRRTRGAVLRGDDPLPPQTPLALQVELTSNCQLRCRMCPLTTGTSSTSTHPGDMEPAVWSEVFRAARTCGHVILVGYGEALLHADASRMLRELDDAGIDIALSTNGISLSPGVAQDLAALRHLALVNVSLDTPDPRVYRQVRVGSLERAIEGLRNLMAQIRDPQLVSVSALAMTDTLPSLVDLLPLLAELGVRRFELQSVMDYTGYAREQRLLGRPELRTYLDAIRDRCAELDIDLAVFAADRLAADADDPERARSTFYGDDGEAWDPSRTRVCHVPWEVPFVDKDGGVFPCCFAGSQNASRVGSLAEQTFDEIWSGGEFRRFREAITSGHTTPDICRRCTVAPLGEHLFARWRAVVDGVEVEHAGRRTATVTVAVRNTGPAAWTADDHVRVGTSDPRDAESSWWHETWVAPNRAAEIRDRVEPGSAATVSFVVATGGLRARPATFELVAEGACWIPNTRFVVAPR